MNIQTTLKRTFHGVALLLIGVVAYFQARGAGQLIGMALMSHAERKSLLPEHDGNGATATPTTKSGQAILERNPFDSATGPLPGKPRGTVNGPPIGDASDPLAWPLCEGVQVLIVTESSDPSWSLASVRASDEPRARLRRVGDGIAGKQVAFIGFNPRHQLPSVWLQSSGIFCQSLMFQRAAPAEVPEPIAVPVTTVAAADIPRHQASIMSQVRVVPEQRNGKVIGLRLFGIRPGSVLGTVGLRNGDRLESINGFEIASPEKALQVYAQLRTARHLRVLLTRVGKPLEIDLNIT
jgi:general secretion pathway protein C